MKYKYYYITILFYLKICLKNLKNSKVFLDFYFINYN